MVFRRKKIIWFFLSYEFTTKNMFANNQQAPVFVSEYENAII